MLKFSVSLIAVMSVMMSLSDPAWCVGGEDDEASNVSSKRKRAQEKGKEKEGSTTNKKARTDGNDEDNSDIQDAHPLFSASLEGLPPEVRVIIYNHLFSENYAEDSRNLLSVASTHPLFYSEIFAELPRITERFKRLIPNAEIEKWSEDPLLAYCQARAIDTALRSIKEAVPTESEKVEAQIEALEGGIPSDPWFIEDVAKKKVQKAAYMAALKEGSPISNSRILIHEFATWGHGLLHELAIYGQGMMPYTVGVNPLKELAITRALEAAYSLWTEYKTDKVRRKFNLKNYQIMLDLRSFVGKNDNKRYNGEF